MFAQMLTTLDIYPDTELTAYGLTTAQVAELGHPGFVGDLIRREDQVMARKSLYSAELRRRAVAMVADVRSEYDTEFAAITSMGNNK